MISWTQTHLASFGLTQMYIITGPLAALAILKSGEDQVLGPTSRGPSSLWCVRAQNIPHPSRARENLPDLALDGFARITPARICTMLAADHYLERPTVSSTYRCSSMLALLEDRGLAPIVLCTRWCYYLALHAKRHRAGTHSMPKYQVGERQTKACV